MLKRGISMITLGVKDLEKSIKFYENLGWKLSSDSDPAMCTFIKTPNITIGLVEYKFLADDIGIECSERKPYNGFTLAINGESVEEVNNIFQKAIDAGAIAHESPRWKDWGGYDGYSGYIKDLDGYYWEIAYASYLETDESGAIKPR